MVATRCILAYGGEGSDDKAMLVQVWPNGYGLEESSQLWKQHAHNLCNDPAAAVLEYVPMYQLLESYRGAPCHHTWKNAIVSSYGAQAPLETDPQSFSKFICPPADSSSIRRVVSILDTFAGYLDR